MFMCSSFEEMEKYICGNKERKCVMETLKNFVLNENLPTYNYEEYLSALHKEIEEEAKKEGHEKGMAEGIKEGKRKSLIEVIQKMKSLNISLEDISKVTGLSIDEIKNIKEV